MQILIEELAIILPKFLHILIYYWLLFLWAWRSSLCLLSLGALSRHLLLLGFGLNLSGKVIEALSIFIHIVMGNFVLALQAFVASMHVFLLTRTTLLS